MSVHVNKYGIALSSHGYSVTLSHSH